MATFLPSLYKEYQDLSDKLSKVSNLIASYGGEIPNNTISPQHLPLTNLPQNKSNIVPVSQVVTGPDEYPKSGTWKTKVLYAMKQIGKPATAKDISQIILHAEESDDYGRIHSSVTQYTSTMGKSGEIGVDASDFRNKYFLNT